MFPTIGQIPKHYSPVRHSTPGSKLPSFPFDLHVLSMPPAFNLSQDQTLHIILNLIRAHKITKKLFDGFARTFDYRVDTSTHTNYLIILIFKDRMLGYPQADLPFYS